MDWILILSTLCLALITSTLGVLIGRLVASRLIHPRLLLANTSRTASVLRSLAKLSPMRYTEIFPENSTRRSLVSLSTDVQRAIGLNLVTQEEIAVAGSESMSQSNLAFGLIFPISLFLYAAAYRMRISVLGRLATLGVVLFSNAALFVVGMERLSTNRLNIQSLILGKLEKQLIELLGIESR